jgi:hypothetical protein
MSLVLWKSAMTPGPTGIEGVYDPPVYDGRCSIPRAIRFPMTNEEIVELPDARLYRSLSRAGLLLISAGLSSRPLVQPFLDQDPFRVGIYCALEQGPNDFACAKEMVGTPPEVFAATYKKLRSAKQYLNQLPSVPPSQLGILLGAMGPQNVYQHSQYACLHALEQAEADLSEQVVNVAIVCSVFSLEDPLINMRVWQSMPDFKPLSEVAVVVVLASGHGYRDWTKYINATMDINYGIAQPLMRVIEDV